ncbi:MAG: Hpt domain-containing protein [Treponema sp.]|nr:Hpt domain-containing protein [Treponema sp.]
MAEKMYIDFAAGVNRVGNNTKFFIKMLTKFRNETTLDKMEEALAAENFEEAKAVAHTIKGVAGNLSLSELADECLKIETQIKANAVDSGQLAVLKTVFDATIAEIDKVLAENE